jgi:hypothetical protein
LTTLRQGNLRAEKTEYCGEIWCCLWTPSPYDEDVGHCYDFPFGELENAIALLEELRHAEAVVIEEEDV